MANYCSDCGTAFGTGNHCTNCGNPRQIEVSSDKANSSQKFIFSLDNLNKPASENSEMPAWLRQGIFWFAIVGLGITILSAIGGGK